MSSSDPTMKVLMSVISSSANKIRQTSHNNVHSRGNHLGKTHHCQNHDTTLFSFVTHIATIYIFLHLNKAHPDESKGVLQST